MKRVVVWHENELCGSSKNMVLSRNMDTSDLGKLNFRVLCVGSTHINQTVCVEERKVENNVKRAWTESVKGRGKRKVNMTNNWRERYSHRQYY